MSQMTFAQSYANNFLSAMLDKLTVGLRRGRLVRSGSMVGNKQGGNKLLSSSVNFYAVVRCGNRFYRVNGRKLVR